MLNAIDSFILIGSFYLMLLESSGERRKMEEIIHIK